MRTPDEHFCAVGEVELCYETFGRPDDPAVLLIMGLGTQMLAWHEDFCDELARRGFFAVRFDNRDCGHSTRLDHVPAATMGQLIRRRSRHFAYTLDDMAADAAGLLAHLEIDAAHVVGASMGGMIAQVVAAQHPEKVRSLVSIMSSTGSRRSGQPALRVLPYLLRRPPAERDAYIAQLVKVFRVVGSPGFDADEDSLRELLSASFERGVSAEGTTRQLGAVVASGHRRDALRGISAPTLVIHGTADRLISPSGGRATARAIPGARLMLIDGMGHDLPRGVWPRIIDAIVENAARADDRSLVVGWSPRS